MGLDCLGRFVPFLASREPELPAEQRAVNGPVLEVAQCQEELEVVLLGLACELARVGTYGRELSCSAMFFWAGELGVNGRFIQSDNPTQNAFVESINGKFREYRLDLHWFASLENACSTLEERRARYNDVRPHQSLRRRPPAVFAQEVA